MGCLGNSTNTLHFFWDSDCLTELGIAQTSNCSCTNVLVSCWLLSYIVFWNTIAGVKKILFHSSTQNVFSRVLFLEPWLKTLINFPCCFSKLSVLNTLYIYKRSFFQAAVVSILLYGCTTWTLTKRLERKLDGNYTRMLRAVLNKSWRQHPTRHQLYGHLSPITKTIQVRRTRYAGHCWRSKDELVSDVLLWTPTYGCAKVGRPARTYIQQLCKDTGCNPEDLPEAMNDREKWRERVRDIRAGGATWWWYIYVCIYIYIL